MRNRLPPQFIDIYQALARAGSLCTSVYLSSAILAILSIVAIREISNLRA